MGGVDLSVIAPARPWFLTGSKLCEDRDYMAARLMAWGAQNGAQPVSPAFFGAFASFRDGGYLSVSPLNIYPGHPSL